MMDGAIIAICTVTLATVQGVTTAWLTHTVNRNACGAEKCLATLAREKQKLEENNAKKEAQSTDA